MATLFYDHLIDWKNITDALNDLGIDGEERLEIIEDSEHAIHTEVLFIFVAHLPAERHEEFVTRFAAAPHDASHFEFLMTYGQGDVTSAVKKRTDELIGEI